MNQAKQSFWAEGFMKEVIREVLRGCFSFFAIRKSGDRDDSHRWIEASDHARERRAIQIRHAEIGDHELDVFAARGEKRDRFRPISRSQHPITVAQ